MSNRSLTQVEAEAPRRAAGRRALRHRGRPHRPADRARGAVRLDGDVHVPASPARAPSSTARPRWSAATLNGVALPPAEDGRIALTDLAEPTTCCGWRPCRRTPATGEGVHKAVDPADGEVYVWTSFEPDEARYVWACFDQPDLKAPHAFTVTAPAALDGGQQLPATRGRRGRRRTPAGGRSRDTPPLSTYNPVVNAGPFHEIRREVDGYDLGLLARRSLAPILERDADELFTLTGQGLAFFGERVRDAVPAAQVRPGLRARVRRGDGELRLRHLVRRVPAPVRRRPPAERELLAQVPAARDGAHVVRQHRHDALVGRPVAQRGVRRVRLPLGGRAGHRVHRRVGRRTWPASKLERLPRRPGPGLAPDPPAHPRRRARPRRSSTRSPTPRAPRCCSSSCTYVGEEQFAAGHGGLLRPARLGQHHPAGPHRRARREPAAATSTRWRDGLAGDRRHRPAHAATATATASCSSPGARTAPPRPQVLARRRLPPRRRRARRASALARVEVAAASARRWTCRPGPTSTWSTTTT